MQNYCEIFNKTNLKLSPVAFYAKDFDPNFFMNHHQHNYCEFMYSDKGPVDLSFYNAETKTFKVIHIQKNELIYINPMIIHKLIIPSNVKTRILNIEFALIFNSDRLFEKSINCSSFFTTYLKELFDNKAGYYIVRDSSLISKTFNDLVSYLEVHKEKDYVDQSMYILTFFYSIKKSLEISKEGNYSFIRTAIEYMNANLEKNLSIETIANYVNKSPSYFAHMFKQDRGVSVLKYFNNLRIDKARMFLKNTSLSISDIALRVGFKNKDQLNYQFHALLNCTASEYKKSMVQKEIDELAEGYYSQGFENLH